MSQFLMLVLLLIPLKQSADASRQVLRAPRGRCSVTLTVGRLGGFRILQLPNHADIQDVNGTAWFNSSTLIYSVSPINNENPGIFSYGCTTRKTTTIKSAKRTAEYMELARIGRDKFIYLYYAPDVDKMDFKTLRQPQNLYRIRINGTGFSISPARHK